MAIFEILRDRCKVFHVRPSCVATNSASDPLPQFALPLATRPMDAPGRFASLSLCLYLCLFAIIKTRSSNFPDLLIMMPVLLSKTKKWTFCITVTAFWSFYCMSSCNVLLRTLVKCVFCLDFSQAVTRFDKKFPAQVQSPILRNGRWLG